MRTEEYMSGGRSMPMDVFEPAAGHDRIGPVVAFFHGGAWRLGDRAQFHPQCQRFAAAGFVAVTAGYALDGPIVQCARDARAAVDHILDRADDWGIDRDRMVVGGGSAGGHLAACLASCPEVVPAVRPAAAILFNPCLDLVSTMAVLGDLAPDVGVPTKDLSPQHQDLGTLPPTLVFHGTADSLIPIDQSRCFRDAAVAAGARCELVELEGREHAFFNPVPPEFGFLINAGDFDATVTAALAFLDEVLG